MQDSIDRYPTWARRSDAQWMPVFPEKYDIGAHSGGVNIHNATLYFSPEAIETIAISAILLRHQKTE